MAKKRRVNVVSLQEKSKISKAETARRVGVPRTTYVNWLCGRTLPDLINARKVAREFKVSLDDIFFPKEVRIKFK